MNLLLVLIMSILGASLNSKVVDGMFYNRCNKKLSREDYIQLDDVCDECYKEWQSTDIYYNCP